MTTAEALAEVRVLVRQAREVRAPDLVRQLAETARELAAYGTDPVFELRLRLLRRRVAVRAAYRP